MTLLARLGIELCPLVRNLCYRQNRFIPAISNAAAAQFHKSSAFAGVKGIEIKMPSLSPTMTEGTIVKWLKKEGESFVPGDVLCEIQTDKAVVAFEMEEEGILAKILVPEDTKDIKIGTLIALMVEEGEDWKDVEIPETAGAAPSAEASQAAPSATPSAPAPETKAPIGAHGLIGPAVRAILHHYSVDPSQVPASGPHNSLLKGDVLQYIKSHNMKPKEESVSAPQPAKSQASPPPTTTTKIPIAATGAEFVDTTLTNMRRTIAKRLTESKTSIPHAYQAIECSVKEVLKLRKQLKDEGISVSVNDFIIKASAVALQLVPEVNCLWVGNGVQKCESIDISIAVATDSGLITPIVKDAVSLGVEQISNTIKDLAARARQGKLQLHEFQGGSFSISNLGMFGITEFCAVINPPQAAILAIGTSKTTLGEDMKPQSLMTVTLSYDGRVFDEEIAARFLEAFRNNIENPMNMVAGLPLRDKAKQ